MAAPTDPYELLQFSMIRVHETFKCGYDVILPLLARPPKDDLKNFLGYCEAWAAAIEIHHDSEEEVIFPFLNQKMDFSAEIEEHQVIHDQLGKILSKIHDAQADPSKFDSVQMLELMTAFKEPLYAHLDEEVKHVAASELKAANFPAQDIPNMLADLQRHAKTRGDHSLVVPFIRSHTPPEYKDTWPDMPWFVRKLIVPYIMARKHSGYWKYSPYAMS